MEIDKTRVDDPILPVRRTMQRQSYTCSVFPHGDPCSIYRHIRHPHFIYLCPSCTYLVLCSEYAIDYIQTHLLEDTVTRSVHLKLDAYPNMGKLRREIDILRLLVLAGPSHNYVSQKIILLKEMKNLKI